MLTPAWTELRDHPVQERYIKSRARFKAVAAGRRSGKTEISKRLLAHALFDPKPWPNPRYFYAAPTRDQAKKIAWLDLKALIPASLVSAVSETELHITTIYNQSLWIIGMDKPARAEGVGWDGGIVDESCDHKPGAFDLSLRPALSDRLGWCYRIGVPKRAGPSAAEFKSFFEVGLSGEDPQIESFTWPSKDILPPEEVEAAKRQLTDKDFNEQYNASWESVGGLVFYSFSDIHNVRNDVCYSKDLSLLVGCDFNVDPMAWSIGQVRGTELHIFDELFIRNTNTEEALKELAKRYGDHQAGVTFFGDATGKARKTAASTSDYIQIRNFKGIKDARVMFPEANPPRHDRFASCNAMFKNAAGERRCFIHPRCKNLIRDLVSRAYTAGTSEPDDHDDISHSSDALGYKIHWLFPLKLVADAKPPSMPSIQ